MILNHSIKGHGEPIVLLHGLFGSLENLGGIARQLEPHYQVLSIDLPDHGLSPRSEQFSFNGYADAVIATLDSLGLQQVNLLGHSLGGKIAMQMALDYPDRVAKLVVADIAPVSYAPRHQNVFKALHSFAPESINTRQSADSAMAEHLPDKGVRQFLLKSLQKNQEGNFSWRFNLPLLYRDYAQLSQGIVSDRVFSKDTLFIKGGQSDYVTAAHQETILRLFPAAKAKIIANTGHWLHAEKPFVFAGLVSSFLAENDGDQTA